MRPATPATQHGSDAAFTLGLGIPTMKASAAMHRHADRAAPATDGAGGAENGFVVGCGPTTVLASIDFELIRGGLRLCGPGMLCLTPRNVHVASPCAQGPVRSVSAGNPPRVSSIGV